MNHVRASRQSSSSQVAAEKLRMVKQLNDKMAELDAECGKRRETAEELRQTKARLEQVNNEKLTLARALGGSQGKSDFSD